MAHLAVLLMISWPGSRFTPRSYGHGRGSAQRSTAYAPSLFSSSLGVMNLRCANQTQILAMELMEMRLSCCLHRLNDVVPVAFLAPVQDVLKVSIQVIQRERNGYAVWIHGDEAIEQAGSS